jgi:hypothetical protein
VESVAVPNRTGPEWSALAISDKTIAKNGKPCARTRPKISQVESGSIRTREAPDEITADPFYSEHWSDDRSRKAKHERNFIFNPIKHRNRVGVSGGIYLGGALGSV